MKRASVLVLVVAIAAALAAGLGRASAPSRIVFTADRAPSVSGEIYRLDPNGQLVDLTNSPFQDSAPVVSPDGQHIAFFSDQSGELSVWESEIDGAGAVQVGPSLRPPLGSGTWQSDYIDPLLCPCEPRLAWQPDGDHLALIATPGNGDHNTLFILAAGQEPLPVTVGTSYDDFVAPDWSPDGKVLVAYDGGVVRAFSPSGSPLWTVSSARSPWPELWSWSRHGLLALPILPNANPSHHAWSGLRVYNEPGQVQFAIRGPVSGAPGWSSDGTRLAAFIDHRLEVLTAAGKRLLSVRLNTRHGCSDVVWASSTRVVVGGFDRSGGLHPPHCQVRSVDLRTRTISPASTLWFDSRSADGKVAAFASKSSGQIAIGVAPTSGRARTTYAKVPACAVASLQFAGPTRSLVFASACGAPPTDLYSIEPDGSGLQQITTAARITDPALSPDSTRIAYSGADIPDGGIGIRDSTGAKVDIAPPPAQECHATAGETYSPPDSWPSWSPDGTTILFSRPDCDWQPWLYTVPASDGTPHPLGLRGDQAAWGPSRIAYAVLYGGIWTANPDGSNPVQISTSGSNPAWSGDGRLAYLTGTNNTTVVVGSTQTQLPFTEVTSLAWSPDATRLVVTARTTPTGPFDVYTVNTDGSNPIQLTHNYDALDLAGWR
jgi:Tol biopolymer transport system component